MIIADRFLWLHLPKTGGTSMTRLFRELQVPGVAVDPDDTRAKHDSVTLREERGCWRAGSRRRFITARRLEAWLLSDWRHKRQRMGLPGLDFAPVRSGLFYSLRLGGVWVAADWWLAYFGVDEQVTALRLEHLRHDFNRLLLPELPAGTPELQTPPRENRTLADGAGSGSGDPAATAFSPADRRRIAAVNPRWSAWQERLYGDEPGSVPATAAET
ncbi:hypothetical protein EVJ50_09035 [Synechococcus sp. RSCCF101]|uniref:hypothetical protein n=1 Tax=Synechococcus sp. RSCCF101 TaxID=2511069 RepID=UPI001245412F|nr:hypothetical protein [Synechococcus sp. RSCCF101]QEY32343.1 hypothetical protein EVJ50_09035 [Synechococcus sp. RSCCF101]